MQLTAETAATPVLLTADEAAKRCRVSRAHIYRLIAAGELPAVKVGSGPQAPIRVDAAELERWLFSSAGSSPPSSPHSGRGPAGAAGASPVPPRLVGDETA